MGGAGEDECCHGCQIDKVLSSCEVGVYRVSQVAPHEASGRRHDVACDGSDVAPEGRGLSRTCVCDCL